MAKRMARVINRAERLENYYIAGSQALSKKTRIKYFNKIIDEIKTAKKSFNFFGFSSSEEDYIKAHLK